MNKQHIVNIDLGGGGWLLKDWVGKRSGGGNKIVFLKGLYSSNRRSDI